VGARKMEAPLEAHHTTPRCLLRLHENANGAASGSDLNGEAIQAWLEWEMEAMRWRVPVEISREDLDALVGGSAELMERSASATGSCTRATGSGGVPGEERRR